MKTALLAATLLAGIGGMALAQGTPTYDPAQLPETKGKVAQYTLTPRGDVDGFILADGTEVHVAPFVSTQLVYAVHPGDAVTIHGLKARAVPMVAAVSVTNDASGVTVTAQPMRMHGRGVSTEVTGKVKAALHTPRGDVDGVLLDDGTEVRLPPPDATKLAETLTVGHSVLVRGAGVTSPLGKLVMARQIGPDKDHLTEVKAPSPHDMMGWRGMMGHGPKGHGPGGHDSEDAVPN
jgi:hypothetical protein